MSYKILIIQVNLKISNYNKHYNNINISIKRLTRYKINYAKMNKLLKTKQTFNLFKQMFNFALYCYIWT
jgi:hypothetical protein